MMSARRSGRPPPLLADENVDPPPRDFWSAQASGRVTESTADAHRVPGWSSSRSSSIVRHVFELVCSLPEASGTRSIRLEDALWGRTLPKTKSAARRALVAKLRFERLDADDTRVGDKGAVETFHDRVRRARCSLAFRRAGSGDPRRIATALEALQGR